MVKVTQTQRETPPSSLLLDTAAPSLEGVSLNRDLLRVAVDALEALGSCNADKGAIRAWAAEKTQP